MRILVTGASGELGHRVVAQLAASPAVEVVVGMDVERPKRRLRGVDVHVVDPRDRHRVVPVVRDLEPTAVAHLGVYEPEARSSPALAAERSSSGTLAVLGAAVEVTSLDRIVVRSGLEVYGRGRGSALVPDESVPPRPTTGFGRSVLEVERLAAVTGRTAGVRVSALRFAPIVGPRFPSPLARFLRLPAVPFSALADPPFSVVHVDDAADAVVAAVLRAPDGPCNVLAPGAVTVLQAALLGGRIPVPMLGHEWPLVRWMAGLAGVAVPDHLLELVHRGRTAESGRAADVLGWMASGTTRDVLAGLHSWPTGPALHAVADDEAA